MDFNTNVVLLIEGANATPALFPPHILRHWTGVELPFDEREELALAFTYLQNLEEDILRHWRKAISHKERMKLSDLMAVALHVRRYYLKRLVNVLERVRPEPVAEPHAYELDPLQRMTAVAGTALDPQARQNVELSPRQTELLLLAAEGLTSAQMSEILGISAQTIKNHLTAAYRVLGVSNREAAVTLAHRLGLIDISQEAGL